MKVGDPIHVNGRPCPSHDALRVDWAVGGTDKSGTIPAEKFTSDATLITIAADALDELKAVREDGVHGFNPEADGPLTIAYKGATLAVEFKADR